jgi:hypothetical protein
MELSGNPQWLVPLKERSLSGVLTQNFLWKHGNVYIMDNHRAALWCWLQEIKLGKQINLLHIDEHYDTLYSQMDLWLASLPPLEPLSIHDYLAVDYLPPGSPIRAPIIRWDNYLSIFLDRYNAEIRQFYCATHKDGDVPRSSVMLEIAPDHLAGNVAALKEPQQAPWIVNIDLDYFFCDQTDRRKRMFSGSYIEAIFGAIREAHEAGNVACLTLCLSPDEELTGGWEQAEALCGEICTILGIDFALGS